MVTAPLKKRAPQQQGTEQGIVKIKQTPVAAPAGSHDTSPGRLEGPGWGCVC